MAEKNVKSNAKNKNTNNVKNTKSTNKKSNDSANKKVNRKAAPDKVDLDYAKTDVRVQERHEEKKKTTSSSSVVMPYVLMIFSLVLAISFFTVRLLQIDDGAGVIGYAIQWFFCGLLGTSAFFLPLILFYVGLRKCMYNIKWSGEGERKATAEHNRAKDRKRVNVITVTGFICVWLLSVIFGVINDYASFDIVDMWTDAAEGSGEVFGGLLGSSFGMLMVMSFEKVISIIILAFGVLAATFFATGLTPGYIVTKIQERREIREELRAMEEEEALRLESEAAEEARKHRNRMLAAQMREQESEENIKTRVKTRKNMSADELMADEESNDDDMGVKEPEVEFKPLDMSMLCATPSNISSDVYIGTDGAISSLAREEEMQKEENVGEDYGGDPAFDTNEYSGVQSVLDGLGAVKTISEPQQVEETKKNNSVDDLLDGFEEDSEKETINLEKMENEELLSEVAAVAPEEGEEDVEVITPYVFPPVDMLAANPNSAQEDFSKELNENAQNLLSTLASFKVSIDAITYSRGPTITRYELKPAAGTRVRAIANLVDDIALSLATTGVRIEAPIPNKPAVGIEVPNRTRATVYLRDLIDSPKFFEAKSRLTACLGMDVGGNPIYFDISKMPHLLIAGATGMGKSVCINTVIISLLYKAKPDELKLILIDPKKVEFNIYKNIPHLYAPIVSDPKKAAGALASAVAEMERRFELIEDVGVRDIAGYNAVTENDPEREFMPHMVIIIDELADLMMTAPDEVETSICRLAQKARAAGIHIIIGTQRPSVDVITGLIKANIPSRIACTVASQTDSRTILDIAGAEKLIGRGDMLFAPVGASKPMRVQGAFVSEGEVENIVTYIRDNNAAGKFNSEFIHRIEEEAAKCGMGKKGAQNAGFDSEPDAEEEGGDSKFNEAVKLAIEEGKISTSLMQRRLGVGYGRAAKIIDAMEERGYVSKPDGNKPRRVLITMEEYMRRKMANELDDISDDNL